MGSRRELQPDATGRRRNEHHARMPFERPLEECQVRRIVLDVEDPSGRELDRRLDTSRAPLLRPSPDSWTAVELDPERRAHSHLAVEADRTAHRLDRPSSRV